MPQSSFTVDREPMYGTMTTALIKGAASKSSMSSKSSSPSFLTTLSEMPLEQVLGFSAVAGASVVVVKVTLYIMGSKKKPEDSESLSRSASISLLGMFRRFLRRLLLDEPSPTSRDAIASENEGMSPSDGKVISHQGSCHCESIQFRFLAPRCLLARVGPGKIQYRHAQIIASNFRIYAGHECLKTYYVYRNNSRKGAHAFCDRCGVHILYAPSKRTPHLNINVNCVEGNGVTKIRTLSDEHPISDGLPDNGQWDTSDQLSTISEVTQPFHFQLSHMHSDSGDWKSYHRSGSSDLFSVGENEDDGDSSVPIKKVSVPPPNPVTPSTISSSTIEMENAYGSQLAQLKMMAPTRGGAIVHGSASSLGANSIVDDLTNDDMSLSDEASQTSAHQKLMASNSVNIRRMNKASLSRPPRYSTGTFTSTASSPEMRNKMRYFMGKYKHHHQNHDSEASSGTATTAASSTASELN
ncbi:hypothetical protein IV203_038587 [Nitzschia inconspicua]|uniref:CENP-V/GFA domain-containing protein n=1 Tax=Nitzschia inconspicua TaxID=303405 RepID=A0A9K3Q1Z4_9STRA|nr:hypothetical protein IV203_038587 [Nitzschia inconspicua]